ncbi:uncharacterized protein BJ171DRAFT_495580 [Polychytrium aggregatum]|uniref:uncharacterized protein n=1 Tax=Polychytrium aggregatum TaxID=110093 RepID=UPI0022FE2774|nr:uncharacterized protein BJ171DRAFT_495580 [Polychytrium aggregatum]KAI9207075.1 hypothetical protein BJ171DRAFT_495580 [Polychytrium aggregatum]
MSMLSSFQSQLNKAVGASRDAVASIQHSLKYDATSGSQSPSQSSASLPTMADSSIRPSVDDPLTDTPRASMDSIISQMDLAPGEIQEKLSRLKKYESKFTDLVKAYKLMQKKNTQIESIIRSNTPIAAINNTHDVEAFDTYLKSIRQRNDISAEELTKLTRELKESREAHRIDITSKTELLSSLQAMLDEREKEIEVLKQQQTAPATPAAPVEEIVSPRSSFSDPLAATGHESTLQLKLKIRELTNSVKKMAEQRDEASARCEELRVENEAMVAKLMNSDVNTVIKETPLSPTISATSPVKTDTTTILMELETSRGKDAKLAQLQLDLAQVSQEKSQFEVQCRGLDEELVQRKQQVEVQDAELTALKNETSLLKLQLSEISGEKSVLETEKLHLVDQIRVSELALAEESRVHQEELSRLGQSIAQLNDRLDQLSSAKASSESQLQSALNSVADLGKRSDDLASELAAALDNAKDADSLRQERAQLAAEATKLTDRIAELESLQKLAAEEREKSSAQLQSLADEAERHRSELEHARQLHQDAEKTASEQLAAAQQNIDALQKQHDTVSAALQESQQESSRLKASLDQHQRELTEITNKLAATQSELATITKKLESDLSESASREGSLKSAVERLEIELGNSSSRATALEAEVKDLQAQLGTANTSSAQLQIQLDSLQSETHIKIRRLESSLSERDTSIHLLNGQVADLKQQLDGSDHSDASIRLVETEAKLRKLHLDLEEIHAKSLQAHEEEKQRQIKYQALAEEKKQADLQLVSLQEQSASRQAALDERSTAYEALKQQADRLQHELEAARADCVAAQQQIEDARNRQHELEHAAESLKTSLGSQIQQLAQTIEQQNEHIKVLEPFRDLHTQQEERARVLGEQLEDLRSKTSALEDQEAAAKQKAAALAQQLNESDAAVRALKQADADHTKRLSVLQGELVQVRGDLESARVALSEKEDKLGELEDVAQKAREAKEHLKAAKARVVELELALEESTKKSEELAEKAEREWKQLTELQAAVQTATNQSAEIEKRLQTSQEQHQQLQEASKRGAELLEGEKRALQQRIEELTAQLDQGTVDGAKFAELQTQLDKLAAEKETLQVQVVQAEMLRAQVDSLTRRYTESQDQVTVLQESLEQRASEKQEFVHRVNSAEESLALAKQTIHQRDETIGQLTAELGELRTQYEQTEEKKIKVVQLLRSSKNRIIKLEADVKLKEDEAAKLQERIAEMQALHERDLREREGQMATVTRQLEDMHMRLRGHEATDAENESKKAELASVADQLRGRITELEASLRDQVSVAQSLRAQQANLTTSQAIVEAQADQLRQWSARMREMEERLATLDDELDTSKKLFQKKSIENDGLKVKLSELETEVYNANQATKVSKDERETLKREQRDLKSELNSRENELKKLDDDLKTETLKSTERIVELEEKMAELEESNRHLSDTIASLQEAKLNDGVWQAQIEQERQKSGLLEEKILALEEELRSIAASHEDTVSELRMREGQLKNLNKALKEEVRKLSRNLSHSNSQTNLNQGANGSSASSPIERRGSTTSNHSMGSGRNPSQPGSAASSLESLPDPNTEYIKNIIIKFLEFKDKRAQLLQVLGMILKFTPDELKKVQKYL